jgi:hypothetical protein
MSNQQRTNLMSFKQFKATIQNNKKTNHSLAEAAESSGDDDVGSLFAMIPLNASDHDETLAFVIRQIKAIGRQAGIAVSVIPF